MLIQPLRAFRRAELVQRTKCEVNRIRGQGGGRRRTEKYNLFGKFQLLSTPLSPRKFMGLFELFNRYAHSAGPDWYTGLSAKLIE